MNQLTANFSLKNYNTFGIDVKASKAIKITAREQLSSIENLENCLILGGGSNVLFTQDVNTTVVINCTRGIDVVTETESFVDLEIASGENWHELVLHCVANNWGGIENMSLIPGSVGAAPMQNIGAYGVEIKDVLIYVKAIDLHSLAEVKFTNDACQFGYRESIFKKELKGKYFISAVGLRLTKKDHKLNTSYGAISEVLNAKNISSPSIADVSKVVIEIRQSKLPDPKLLGNAGSFFKNPVISLDHFNSLKLKFENIKSYPVDGDNVKVPAGWLIESLGWKGKKVGHTGSHKDQALVLVNYGGAVGQEVKELSEAIKKSVWDTYQIKLETEVNIY
ncbi:MAG: UDP-N-acetylenolpyruvoylglucosamine reductase [Bacteroidota bacterium]